MRIVDLTSSITFFVEWVFTVHALVLLSELEFDSLDVDASLVANCADRTPSNHTLEGSALGFLDHVFHVLQALGYDALTRGLGLVLFLPTVQGVVFSVNSVRGQSVVLFAKDGIELGLFV